MSLDESKNLLFEKGFKMTGRRPINLPASDQKARQKPAHTDMLEGEEIARKCKLKAGIQTNDDQP